MQPRQALLGKDVPRRRSKPLGMVKGADVKMRFRRPAEAFAGQSRAASRAKSAARPARRRVELGYLAFGYLVRRVFQRDEHGDWRAAVLAAALAVTPVHPLGPAGRDKADGA